MNAAAVGVCVMSPGTIRHRWWIRLFPAFSRVAVLTRSKGCSRDLADNWAQLVFCILYILLLYPRRVGWPFRRVAEGVLAGPRSPLHDLGPFQSTEVCTIKPPGRSSSARFECESASESECYSYWRIDMTVKLSGRCLRWPERR